MAMIKACTEFLIITLCICLWTNNSQSNGDSHNFVEYYCKKEKECIVEDERVCGYDETKTSLAVFKDECTLYRANCKGGGRFNQIHMIICTTQLQYAKQNENEKDPPSSTPNKTIIRHAMPRVQLKDRYVTIYCRKLSKCTSGIDSVCGFDKIQKIIAEFPNVCILYSANCFRQGRYKKLNTNECKPNITFSNNRITQTNGEVLPEFMTYLPTRALNKAFAENPYFLWTKARRSNNHSQKQKTTNSNSSSVL